MNVIEIFLAFFLFFLPFQFALNPFPGIDLALIRIFALFLFFFWLAHGLWIKRIILPSPKILFLFSSFFLFSLCSLFWSENTFWALRKNMFFLSFAPLFLVFYAVFSSSSLRDTLTKYLLYGAFLSSCVALIQFFSQFIVGVPTLIVFWTESVLPFFLGQSFGAMVVTYPSFLVNITGHTVMRAVGFFPDPHMFSLFLGMTLPFTFTFFQKTNQTQMKWWWFTVGLTLFITDLLTFSRGGYMGLIIGIGVAIFLILSQRGISKKYWLQSTLGISFLITILFLSPIGTRFLSSFSETDTSNRERVRLWEEAGNFIISHPVLGSGLGNYALSVKPSAEYREPIYIHNLYLDITGELGLTGLVLFLSLYYISFSSALRKWRNGRNVYSFALCISLCIFFIHSLFETALFSVHIFPLLLFLLALAIV